MSTALATRDATSMLILSRNALRFIAFDNAHSLVVLSLSEGAVLGEYALPGQPGLGTPGSYQWEGLAVQQRDASTFDLHLCSDHPRALWRISFTLEDGFQAC